MAALTAVVVLELAVVAVVAAAAEVLWTWLTEEDVLSWLAELWVALVEVADVVLLVAGTVVDTLLALVVLGAEADVLALTAGAAVAADVAAWVV